VIAVDTNILVYAHRVSAPLHVPAVDALRRVSSSLAPWLIPLHCLVEFYGNVTNPRVYAPPSTPAEAGKFIRHLLGSPTLQVGVDRTSTLSRLLLLIDATGVIGPQVHDARIVSVCLDYGVSELWSVDRGFSRFPQLRVVNPFI
jgi:hypothetical protein